ncbi:ABC transporter ATP-binding protein [Palleronia sp. LCG004]|uniref:ABC transporter ATP-binding protein n=1 Tax=Palleronia sp. LCG004 TaxID=3079304 RepID=UPI0029430B56|nr:ABC transporter ATP-binding protein [Palleronia sp. LCG004]WOI58312.1 ABC transporter ATP-binding protein [Palleronia sp. LCG004]
MTEASILKVEDLSTTFRTEHGSVPALTAVSFDIRPGETLAVVGESGSGKSVTALSIMRLLDRNARIDAATLSFRRRDGSRAELVRATEKEMRGIRGNEIGMIFQEPMTSLNPVLTVGDQIGEAVIQHRKMSRGQLRQEVLELLRLVGIPAPEHRVDQYPHQMSGGMRQRIMIAVALACRPNLLIADEPTTALDVTIQAQILRLLNRLKAELGMSILFITHDLAVVSEIADRVVVMYGGSVLEQGTVDDVLTRPVHPYTRGLLASLPSGSGARLKAIRGTVPAPADRPAGCLFAPRCDHARELCEASRPDLTDRGEGHPSRCIRSPELFP